MVTIRDTFRNVALYTSLVAPLLSGCGHESGHKNLENELNKSPSASRDQFNYSVSKDSKVYLGIKGFLGVGEGFTGDYETDRNRLREMISSEKDIKRRQKLSNLARHLDYVHQNGAEYFLTLYHDAAGSSTILPKTEEKNYTHFIGDFSDRDVDRIKKSQRNVYKRVAEKNYKIRRIK